MMQRAKKLKYNAERRKKLGKLGKDHSNYQIEYNLLPKKLISVLEILVSLYSDLDLVDPKQRLALFRRLEETNVARKPMTQPSRHTLPRKEYFQGRGSRVSYHTLFSYYSMCQ